MISLDDLQGHWRRAWLKAGAHVDHETAVHWMQAGTLYADIRVPGARPDLRGATSLSDLGNPTLLTLLGAEGFAGEIALDGDICTWNREINWHGVPKGVDAGRMRLEAWSELIEEGVHADYSELWHKSGEANAFAHRLATGEMKAFLVSVGDRFVFGFGDADLAASEAAKAALAAGQRTEALARQFAEGYVFGRWVHGAGVACLATNPLWEGETVLSIDAGGVTFSATDFFGAPLRHRFDMDAEATVAA